MRVTIITQSLLLLLVYFCPSAQSDDKVSGLLLLSPERNDESFDLFLPCKIDTRKTLRQNLITSKLNIAFQTFIPDPDLAMKGTKLRNQDVDDSFANDIKFCLVIPIIAEYDTRSEKLLKNVDIDKKYRMQYTFYGKTISKYYSTKCAYLKSISVIKLPIE